jgi:integrase
MPWRKYSPRPGKYGPIYHVARGIQVRQDRRGLWTLFFEKQGLRTNETFGADRNGLVKAIRAAEDLAKDSGGLIARLAPAKKQELPGFIEFSNQWLKAGVSRWSGFTQERYRQVLDQYIKPEPLFSRSLEQISRREIKHFLRQMARKRSPGTVEIIHGVISGVFTEAVDEEILNANPSSGLLRKILPPESQRDLKRPEPFSRDELDLFFAHASDIALSSERLVLECMGYAGLRLGEALAMRRAHFDSARMSYFAAESFKRHNFSLPKAGKTRLVDLPDFLVERLLSHIERLKLENLRNGRRPEVDLLFPDPTEDGRWPFSQRKIQMLMKRICRRARLRVRNPHDLRHTYATLLLMAHRSPGYVMRQLGHSSIRITMDIYCHWVPGQGREGLEEALGGGDLVRNRVQKSHIIAYAKRKGP